MDVSFFTLKGWLRHPVGPGTTRSHVAFTYAPGCTGGAVERILMRKTNEEIQ
jgi:hypothetical protein